MITGTLGALLQELGKCLGIPNLHPDQHESCVLMLKEGLKIQIELDSTSQFLIIGIDLGPVGSGKYRENIFREALKANSTQLPRHGIFAFSDVTKHLILFEQIPVLNLRGEHIAAEIPFLKEKAILWTGALERKELPPINPAIMNTPNGGLFGLKP